MMNGLAHDIRYALRQIGRNPGFAAAASLTLALGIAATTTVFSFVDAALFRPLPYPEPSRLFVLWNERGEKQRETVSYPNYVDYRDGGSKFENIALYRRRRFNVATAGGAERVQGAFISANFFRTLGLAPAAGRDFAVGEDRAGGDAVALVSDRYWRRQFGSDPGALGRTLRVDGASLRLVKILPSGRGYPADADIWIPISREAKWLLESRGLQGYTILGRLTASTAPEQAQEQMSTLAERLAAEYPRHNEGWTVRLEPLQHALAGIGIYGVMAYLVAQREREIAVRMALGARRSDVVASVIGHSVRLAAPGVLVGLAGTLISARVLRTFLYQVEPTDPVTLALVCFGIATLVVAATLVPARRAADTDPMAVLRGE